MSPIPRIPPPRLLDGSLPEVAIYLYAPRRKGMFSRGWERVITIDSVKQWNDGDHYVSGGLFLSAVLDCGLEKPADEAYFIRGKAKVIR